MNDTPGWASPGSAPSGEKEPDSSGTPRPADQNGANPPEQPSKWSKEQPPPAQWSAPGAQGPAQAPPPAAPSPGWGGRPPGGPVGWGGTWGAPPPAARPGVIPLRPLGVGEILDGAVSTMRGYWRTVLGISLAVAVVTQIAIILLQGFVLDDSAATEALNDPSATLGELSRAMGDTLLSSGLVLLVTLLGTIVATALLTSVTSRAVIGKTVTTSEAWRDARPQLAKLFGLTLLLPLIAVAIMGAGALPGLLVVAGGSHDAGAALAVLGTLAAGLVALWLMIRFSLASPALMLEKQSITKSMRRSAKLVRGSWWRVFGIQLLATIIANILASIIVIPFAVLAAALSGDGFTGFLDSSADLGWTFLIVSGIGSVIGSMITFPITAGVTVLLYIDRRIRREALDLDLARAAGLQDYGSVASGTTGITPGS
ncbi:glycerophosphoryl diester phosphodiesterase membrane domain-containing protein [Streptomyces sp. NBC_00151]|uniref:glycerophosphoryl diester phosphodiesterase membrane domain-containing protein n=1 Tax=Streptomyces sp. NBC_00151 TaxID=2975669 RepID=UPI002DD9B462|nr:glycerophosphoryl diester phosphodiesterase membrane domain-containing protein [Streptomyces sp. NBC_00151]WRZ41398.1 glycerophosphoryl diester phosphodiesterase membrane domain-containing protein [Streptomyces sp. NBC_00151]